MLNNYNWGGYLNWVMPEQLLFIDGRMPQKPLDSGVSYLEEYHRVIANADLIAEKFKAYDIGFVLWPTQKKQKIEISVFDRWVLTYVLDIDVDTMFERIDVLHDYMQENWHEVYRDDIAVIFMR